MKSSSPKAPATVAIAPRAPLVGRKIRHPLTGKSIRVTAPTRAECDRIALRMRQMRNDVRLGLVRVSDVASFVRNATRVSLTVAQMMEMYRDHCAGVATRDRIDSLLNTHLATLRDRQVDSLDVATVDKWIQSMRGLHRAKSGGLRKLEESSIDLYWKCLNAAVAHVLAAHLIAEVPWGDWDPNLRPVTKAKEAARTIDELLALMREARLEDERRRARRHFAQLQALVATMAICGLRNAEASALGWDDVELAHARVTLRYQTGKRWRLRNPSWTRPMDPIKGRKQNVLAIPPALVEILTQHREYLRSLSFYFDDGPVFPAFGAKRGKLAWRDRPTVFDRDVVHELAKRAQLPHASRWTPHSLRHTFVTLESQALKGDLRSLQARTRHASLSSLFPYLHEGHRGALVPALQIPASSESPKVVDADAELVELVDANGRRVRVPRAAIIEDDNDTKAEGPELQSGPSTATTARGHQWNLLHQQG